MAKETRTDFETVEVEEEVWVCDLCGSDIDGEPNDLVLNPDVAIDWNKLQIKPGQIKPGQISEAVLIRSLKPCVGVTKDGVLDVCDGCTKRVGFGEPEEDETWLLDGLL